MADILFISYFCTNDAYGTASLTLSLIHGVFELFGS